MADTSMFQLVAGIVGIIAYIPLIIGIIKSKIEQSFAAFLLWAMIDTIASVTTILEKGNYWLPLANATGSSIIALLLAIKKQVSWTWVETMTTVLVVVCLLIWYAAGETAGIVSSSLAVVIASIPQMVATYKSPSTTPTGPYIIFLTANILSLLAGKSWTIEERFYAGCSVFLCAVIVLFSLRRGPTKSLQ
jgi:uncharacterized protein with PQ loop repeat